MYTSGKKSLLSSPVRLGCASARKLNSDEKDVLFGLDTQITVSADDPA
jgi:hypothetical protein